MQYKQFIATAKPLPLQCPHPKHQREHRFLPEHIGLSVPQFTPTKCVFRYSNSSAPSAAQHFTHTDDVCSPALPHRCDLLPYHTGVSSQPCFAFSTTKQAEAITPFLLYLKPPKLRVQTSLLKTSLLKAVSPGKPPAAMKKALQHRGAQPCPTCCSLQPSSRIPPETLCHREKRWTPTGHTAEQNVSLSKRPTDGTPRYFQSRPPEAAALRELPLKYPHTTRRRSAAPGTRGPAAAPNPAASRGPSGALGLTGRGDSAAATIPCRPGRGELTGRRRVPTARSRPTPAARPALTPVPMELMAAPPQSDRAPSRPGLARVPHRSTTRDPIGHRAGQSGLPGGGVLVGGALAIVTFYTHALVMW